MYSQCLPYWVLPSLESGLCLPRLACACLAQWLDSTRDKETSSHSGYLWHGNVLDTGNLEGLIDIAHLSSASQILYLTVSQSTDWGSLQVQSLQQELKPWFSTTTLLLRPACLQGGLKRYRFIYHMDKMGARPPRTSSFHCTHCKPPSPWLKEHETCDLQCRTWRVGN